MTSSTLDEASRSNADNDKAGLLSDIESVHSALTPLLSTLMPASLDSQASKSQSTDWITSDPLGWDVLDSLLDDEPEAYFETNNLTSESMVSNVTADPLTANVSINSNQPNTSSPIQQTMTSIAGTMNTANMNTANVNNTNMTNADKHNTDNHHANITDPTMNVTSINTSSSPFVDTSIDTTVPAFDGDTSRANPNFRPLLPAPTHRGEVGRQLIMDTETTGLDALKGDRIVEVGIVEMINRKFTGEKLHVYINPERGMDDEVIRIHGISEAFLADKPTFAQVAKPLYDFMLGAEVIAHNASFDISFLSMEFDRAGFPDFAQQIKVTDSLAMAKQQYPGQKNTLDALVRRLNVGKMDRTFHGALLDSEILAEVYLAMTGGQVSLAIDEDVQNDANATHTDYSSLAELIVAAKTDKRAHMRWLAEQITAYPALEDTQNLLCFKALKSPSALIRTDIDTRKSETASLSLANTLFLN